jgi:hypothetical protein
MVPKLGDLPPDAAEWTSVAVSLPEIEDPLASPPFNVTEITDYLRAESADVDRYDLSRLRLLRTAKIDEDRYWIWKYLEGDEMACYLVATEKTDGRHVLELAQTNGLSAEQFLLAVHYDQVYWS